MQPIRTLEKPPSVPKGRRIANPLPKEGLREVRQTAELAMAQIGKKGGPEFASAVESYRRALESLAQECPNLRMWQVERIALPSHIGEQTIRFGGRIEATIPFSLAGCWVNEGLEKALDEHVPQDGAHTFYTRIFAQILDRFVESMFPTERIVPFFRNSVLSLKTMHGEEGYELAVIRAAQRLAELGLSAFLDGNANLLKMSIHKSIYIQTGVALSASHHDDTAKCESRKPRLKLTGTIAGRMGVSFDSLSIARSIAGRWGIPIFDDIPALRHVEAAKEKAEEKAATPEEQAVSEEAPTERMVLPPATVTEGEPEQPAQAEAAVRGAIEAAGAAEDEAVHGEAVEPPPALIEEELELEPAQEEAAVSEEAPTERIVLTPETATEEEEAVPTAREEAAGLGAIEAAEEEGVNDGAAQEEIEILIEAPMTAQEEMESLAAHAQDAPGTIEEAALSAVARAHPEAGRAPKEIVHATPEELMRGMGLVVRTGRDARHSHPDLPGMEFDMRECHAAVRLVRMAEERLIGTAPFPGILSEDWKQALDSLLSEREFTIAVQTVDRRMQMRTALLARVFAMRAQGLKGEFGELAFEKAKEDVRMARDMVSMFVSFKANPGQDFTLRSIDDMYALSKLPEHYGSSDFEIALRVVDSIRGKRAALPPVEAEAAHKETLAPPAQAVRMEKAPEEEAAEQAPKHEETGDAAEEAERPELAFLFGNPRQDDAFEKALPPKTGKRNAFIRQTARNMNEYIRHGKPEIAPPCYKDALARVREGAAPEEIVALAEEIVDKFGRLDEARKAKETAEQEKVEPATAAPAPMAQQETVEEAPSAKAQTPAPRFKFPFRNFVIDNEMEPLLPQDKTVQENVDIRRVARALAYYERYDVENPDIHPLCLEAVQRLRKSYTAEAAVAYAESIVQGRPLPAHVPASSAEEVLQSVGPAEEWGEGEMESVRRVRLEPEKYDYHERNLIAGAMGEEFSEITLIRFLRMEPAHREMLMRLFIASRWTEGDFRTEIEFLERTVGKLYHEKGLRAPTAQEKLSAMQNPLRLTIRQRKILASFFGIEPEAVGASQIDRFSAWVSRNPDSGDDSRILQHYWDTNFINHMKVLNLAQKMQIPGAMMTNEEMLMLGAIFSKRPEEIGREDLKDVGRVVAFAKALEEKYYTWRYTPYEERLGCARKGVVDLMSLGSLSDKLRFMQGEKFSAEESALIRRIYGKDAGDGSSLDDATAMRLRLVLMGHTHPVRRDEGEAFFAYHPEILALASFGYQMSPGQLKENARAEAEYRILLDFLGVQTNPAHGIIQCRHGLSMRKSDLKTGEPLPNEDMYSSSKVFLQDGRMITMDMVADGMGGMDSGANGGLTNGQAASHIAREMFEIASVAGWLKSPEDVRRLMLSIDIAIVIEQIRKKEYCEAQREISEQWRSQGADLENMSREWAAEFQRQVGARTAERMAETDERQKNNMGTTMTVCFQEGRSCWFIHCGDSDGLVMRDGEVAFSTEEHDVRYVKAMEFRPTAVEEISGHWRSQGYDTGNIHPSHAEEFESQVRQRIEEMLNEYRDEQRAQTGKDPFAKNVVCSALGAMPLFLRINNRETAGSPIELKNDDIILLSSDGFSVPVCRHELGISIYGNCAGDLDSARESLMQLALKRRNNKKHDTLCECRERKGKMDDVTLLIRHAWDGLSEDERKNRLDQLSWLERKVSEDAASFSKTASYRLVLDGACGMEKEALEKLFDSFIVAADSAPEGRGAEACDVALSFISEVVSRRIEREELIETMQPAIGEWSGLIIKRLRESEEANPREKVMFDFVCRSVGPEELGTLLLSKNKTIAQWARDAAGLEEPVPESKSPQSMFNSQTDLEGNPLSRWETRYLDDLVLDVNGSRVMQDSARRLGILARDLEILVFYIYTDFDPRQSVEPHLADCGEALISKVANHLCTNDARRIVWASYLIYCLKDTELEPERATEMISGLRTAIRGMDPLAPYTRIFVDRASWLIGPDMS